MRTWITPVSLLANITVTMMVLGLLRKDRCDAYLDHPCLIVGQHHSHHDGVGVAKKGQVCVRTWITPVSLLANITVTMMVLGLLRKDRCDAYLDHPCLIVGQHHSHHDGVGVAKKGQV